MFGNWAANNPFSKADRNQVTQSQPQVNQQTQQQQTQQTSSGVIPDGNTEKNKQTGTGDDPLDNLKTLWDPDKDDKGNVIVKDKTPKSFMPTIDPKKFEEMVGKMKFSDGITAEEIEAIKGGGEGSVGAMMNMLDRAGRKAFTSSFRAANTLAEQGLTSAQTRFMEGIPDHVKNMMVDEGLSTDIGITKNPMFTPLVKSVKDQIMQKFPKANPTEIRAMTKQYFDKMESEFTSGRKSQEKVPDEQSKLRSGADDADFEAWLGEEAKNFQGGGMFGNVDTSVDDSQTQF